MYLYQLMETGYDSHDDEIMRQYYLLQHEKNMSEEEFHKIVGRYTRQHGFPRSLHNIQCDLCNHEGFRLVPNYIM
jgi:hypothetical protein